jgi:peptidoglycan/xylan/chitin deacetylase (PgdA/CDA1 family)
MDNNTHFKKSFLSASLVTTVSVLILIAFTLVFGANNLQREKQIQLVFRFDDTSAKSNIEIDLMVINEFKKHKMRCTFGVIPFICEKNSHDPSLQNNTALSATKIKLLKQAIEDGFLEIALHGYSHQTNRFQKEGEYSEFVGLDYESQLIRAREAKQFLEDKFSRSVTIFVPPWNSYDTNTIKALEKLEFKHLSADIYGIALDNGLLRYIPATCGLKDLKKAISQARKSKDRSPVIVVLFHAYNFKESHDPGAKMAFSEFSEILSLISKQDDVVVKSMEQLDDIDIKRYTANQLFYKSTRLRPQFLLYTPKLVFWSSSNAYDLLVPSLILLALFYAAIVIISSASAYMLSTIIIPKTTHYAYLSRIFTLLLLLLMCYYVFYDHKYGIKGLASIAVALGLCLGVWLPMLKAKRKNCHGMTNTNL